MKKKQNKTATAISFVAMIFALLLHEFLRGFAIVTGALLALVIWGLQ